MDRTPLNTYGNNAFAYEPTKSYRPRSNHPTWLPVLL